MKTINLTDEQYAAAIKEGIIKEDKGWYVPKYGEEYFFITYVGSVGNHSFRDDATDCSISLHQQVFRTEAEAQKELDRQIALTTVRKWCAENVPFTPDWESDDQKWEIAFNYSIKAFRPTYTTIDHCSFTIPYFASKEDALKVIAKFDKELRLIFDVE